MYLVSDVPDGATALHFSILNSAEFDKVVLSNSMKIEDMEPEWFASDEHLCAVVGSSVVGNKLRACITGGSTTASMTWMDFHYYSCLLYTSPPDFPCPPQALRSGAEYRSYSRTRRNTARSP